MDLGIDAGPAPADGWVDAGELDALTNDAGPTLDGGRTEDGGAADAFAPADAAVSADALPSRDAGCEAPFALDPRGPRSAGILQLPFTADLPPLFADADDDGDEEIIVASAAARMVAVLDFEVCRGEAKTTTLTQVPVDRAGIAAALSEGRTQLVVGYLTEVGLLRYEAAAPAHLEFTSRPTIAGTTIEELAIDPTGTAIFLAGAGPASGITHLLSATRLSTTLSQSVRAAASYVAGTPSGLVFLLSGERSPILNTPGVGATDLPDGEMDPTTAPALIHPGALGGSNITFAAYGAGGASTHELGIIRLDLTSGNFDRVALTTPAGLAGPPIAVLNGSLASPTSGSFYFTTTDNRLRGCTLTNPSSPSFACSESQAGTFDLGSSGASPRICPLSAYVNNDASPDLVVATGSTPGRLHFRQQALGQEAAPPLALGGSVKSTPAISVHFFDRYRSSGVTMAIPLDGDRLEIVSWPTPPTAGSAGHLWLQHRSDLHRTGRL